MRLPTEVRRLAAADDVFANPRRRDEFDFSSTVVNDASGGTLFPQPIAADVSASAITAGAKRKPVPAIRLSVTSMWPVTRSLAEWSKTQPSWPGTLGAKNSVAARAVLRIGAVGEHQRAWPTMVRFTRSASV